MIAGTFAVVTKGFRVRYTYPFRLRLSDGTCVFMLFHPYCGPEFFKDKECNRPIENWWENDLIDHALTWFIGRGNKA